ncbi:hypothetical protein E6O75_ATG05786 [Venturia nashicola]|uniref:F-box domain-containing protein n=1 Tax=Venturia nashicola TaxID=86259 RepID=A0A4Z1P904_9PEZI|nr:hypothetical protein E6O75_ATG05786 [Venturia nashicola]
MSRKRLSTGEKFQPRIIESPVELVQSIANQLPLASLGQLRISCKTFKVKTGYQFANKYFASRVVKPE